MSRRTKGWRSTHWEVRLLNWHKDKDRAGFLCGYRDNLEDALAAQQIVEYHCGVPARVVTRRVIVPTLQPEA